MHDSTPDPWTPYWQSGQGDTYASDPATRRPAEDVWTAFFSDLPPGTKLIDLGTGAGHVAGLASETAGRQGMRFEIHGVDLADIANLKRAPTPGADAAFFHGRINLAALPFATGFFDAATSQFGIEYADRGALAEAVRVLKPGGRGLFLLHHAGGIIFEACRTRLQAHRHVLPDDTSFRLAHAVFAQLARGVRPRMIVNDVAQFRAAVNGMARRFAGSGPESNMREAIAFLIDLARAPDRFEPRDALRRLDFVQADIAAWAARQQAMLAAALDDGGIAAVKTALAEAGAVLDPVELCRSESSAVIAWKLAFRKSEP